MKKVLKFFMFLILSVVILSAGYFAYLKFFASKGSVDAFNTIPNDAVFIVETTNLSEAWITINNSDLWKYLIKTSYFADLNEDIQLVNSFIDSNTIADKLLKNRKLVIAGVMSTPADWDFLFAVDLEEGSSTIKSLKSLVDLISGFEVVRNNLEIDGKKYEIIKLIDKNNPDFEVFVTFADNILLVSFNGSIIEKSLRQLNDNHWQTNNKFTEVQQQIPGRKQFKFYVNYSAVDDFAGTFLTAEDETISMLSASLAYSIFNFEISGDLVDLEGFTNLDSVGSYVQALAGVAPGKMTAYQIMTNQAAAYVSIAFDDYNTFYNNLMNEYSKNYPDDAEDIETGMNLVKNVIKIDVENDLFAWFGNEVALFKIRPLSDLSREEDIALVIHANDIDLAKTGMENIVKQIRKWSPFRFDEYEHKGFTINYLKQKGFFKLFLGKIFEGIDEPYFTYIDDYVVFSNSKEVLHQIIDDYLTGQTLANDQKFQDFIDEFEVKSNIAVFLNMPKMYPTLFYFTPQNKRAGLAENEELIKGISRLGFQLVSKTDFFKTTLLAQYDPEAFYEDLTQVIENETNVDLFVDYVDTMGFMFALPDTVSDGNYVSNFDNNQQNVMLEGKVVNGLADGIWRTYYESGNIKSSVTYSEGLPDGVAFFYYDDISNTQRAEVAFEEGKIVSTYKEYYDNGARKANILYKKGLKHGDAEFYYRTGEIKISGKYKDGLKDGKWEFFDENGNKIATEKWNKGNRKK